MNIFIRSSCDP